MKTQDRPLQEDDVALADLAAITDWTPIAGPDSDNTGLATIKGIVERVTAVTDWTPWPLRTPDDVGPHSAGWGFTTPRGSTIVVYDAMAFADARNSGWSAFEIGPDDLAEAEAGLDAHWPEHLELTRKHFGEPTYVGDHNDPDFEDAWAPGAAADKRHLAVWVRPGAELRLFSDRPTAEPLTEAVCVNYAVYIN
ncbi:hypothetical protein [Kribbella kalugense]|uniref:Uncharacterized protein n=1 Tax=Kribbella kalugense TaxID=2512221 RepID=A0A4V3G6K4_9ACTN|nr:hypothetical protein [Kribbella kalugense]TDW15614.1 hypothetical protein EV650_7102 [Kribbella kalugense]